MDHLGIREFLVMGFCIGGPMIHNLIKRAPERVVAAAMMQPSGFRPELPDLFYQNNIKGWGPALCEKRPDVTMAMVHDFLTSMYTNRADFVFTVTRDFVRSLRTPRWSLLHVPRTSTGRDGVGQPRPQASDHSPGRFACAIDEVVAHDGLIKAHEPSSGR